MAEYPNPEFNESKELLKAAEDPIQFPNRKWSYTDGELDVWPVTPMAFPEHKDVWGEEGWKSYSQGHLWYDPETEEWNIFQWPSRPQGLSEKWYHPIQKVKKEEFQQDALEAVKNYVRDNCHAEPVIASRPMPADDAGQAMYLKHYMGQIPWEEMDRLRRQAGYYQQPEPEKWDSLRDELGDESNPQAHPNRKWSHTYGPSGYLDVWPVSDIAYPEHVDVWGQWGWENCSQGHLWWDEDEQKWMVYPWKERPHCLSYSKPKEAAVKEKFINDSVASVFKFVTDVLHGTPELSDYPMPADSRGQGWYSQQETKMPKANQYSRSSPAFDISEIFNAYGYPDENIYWDAKKGVVWWYVPMEDAEDLASVKEELLNIPEVKNVVISNKRPSGPWKKLATTGAELYNTLKVKHLDADLWGNDKGHVPGVYDADSNILYIADGPGHHSDVLQAVPISYNNVAIDFKNPELCVIIAPNPETPREYLEVLNQWIEETRPGCQVAVEFNGDDETRLPYYKYMEQVYEQGKGWDMHAGEPYCEECGEYGHSFEDHDDDYDEAEWGPPPPQPAKPNIDWGVLPLTKPAPSPLEIINNKLNYWYGLRNHELGTIREIAEKNIKKLEGKKDFLLKKGKVAQQNFYYWLYDLDTGEMAIAPSSYSSDEGLEGDLDNPYRWLRGRYWSGRSPEIKIDGHHKASSSTEINMALTKVIRRLTQQEGIGRFFAATADGIIPPEHQSIGYVIWYADERDNIEDQGLKIGSQPIIFTDRDRAERAYVNLKNVDMWQIDMTGNDVFEDNNRPGMYYTTDKFYPEQLHLVYGPHNPPQKNKKKFEENKLRWAYNMESGEMLVAADDKMPSDHWSTLDYPKEWMGGTYDQRDGMLTIMESPEKLDPNRQREVTLDILKKIKTLPM